MKRLLHALNPRNVTQAWIALVIITVATAGIAVAERGVLPWVGWLIAALVAWKVWLVADSAKLMRSAPVRLCNLADLDAVFTDVALPEPLMQLCAEAGTAVHIAGAEDHGC